MIFASIHIKEKIKVLTLILCLVSCAVATAQEYRYELGGMAGASMYMGDANQSSLTKGWNPAGGVVFRNNLNFRWAIKANLLMGKVSGNTANFDNVYPNKTQISFDRMFYELGGHIEFNFLPYSDKYSYLGTSKISPYLLTGLGLTMAPGDGRTFFGINFPLGIGVKYKLKNKLNIGAEFVSHRLFSDSFDARSYGDITLEDPYSIKSGIFKNKDWYNTFLISITWEFGIRDYRCIGD
ncbi:hypothetical protein M2138_002012 [Dysgonomonadaceae bacterium PH5-43]|nr:hypothetical protein [Dysgonomonadaceae bacterium PH5-43]